MQWTKEKRYVISNKKPWSVIFWCTLSQNGPRAASRGVALTWPKDCVNGDSPLGSWNNKGFYRERNLLFMCCYLSLRISAKKPPRAFYFQILGSNHTKKNTVLHHPNACSFRRSKSKTWMCSIDVMFSATEMLKMIDVTLLQTLIASLPWFDCKPKKMAQVTKNTQV